MTVLKILADGFHEGGWGMWPILALLMITMAILIERAVFLRRAVIDKEKLVALLRSQISAGNIQGAIKVCSGNSTPLTRIVQAGLMRANRSDEEIAAAMEEAGLRELPQLEKRTGYLAMLGNLATLAGLLGHHHGSHQVVRRRRRCRPVAEGDAAVEGHLGGDELHRLRSVHRHHRPRRLRVPERQDPERPRRHRRGPQERFESAVPGQGGACRARPRTPTKTFQPTTTKNKENDSCSSWSTFKKAAGACGPSSLLLGDHRLHHVRPLDVRFEVQGRRRQADVAAEVADRLGQHPGRDQHLPVEPGAGHPHHRGRPAPRGWHGARRSAGDGRGSAPRAAEDREAHRLPGHAG